MTEKDNDSIASCSTEVGVESSEKDKIELNILLKFIKPFDGTRENLNAYLSGCKRAFNLAIKNQTSVLLDFAITQLEGKAETAVANHTFQNWEELSEFLKLLYGNKKHHSHLLVELQQCKQIPRETISQYIVRIETAAKRLIVSVQQSIEDSSELKGRIAAMNDLILHTFVLNVDSRIGNILRARNVKNLSEAMQVAIEEEKILNLVENTRNFTIKNLPNNRKFCKICKKTNHNTNNCFRNNETNKSSNVFMGNTNPKSQNYERLKYCNYCKENGHLINECRKRMYNEERKTQNNGLKNSKNGETSSNRNGT